MDGRRIDVSVIVPCYNSQKYLKDCLDSLQAQRSPEIEMILIDDGSADETGRMLDAFAAAEPRARVVHKENGGVSSARNRGIDLARGRYIAFLDADDTLAPGCLQMLFSAAESTGAQIVSAKHMILDMDANRLVPVVTPEVEQKPYAVAREIIHMHRIYNNIWNKLYDRRLFDSGARLDPQVRIGEDALLNLQLYLHAEKTLHLDSYTYVYRVHGMSAMARIDGYSAAHQPMLRSMSRILSAEGVKERFFADFLQSCIWRDEKESGIRASMKRFNRRIRPLVVESIDKGRLDARNRTLYAMVRSGVFPAFYVLMRVREKITGKRWGIRR